MPLPKRYDLFSGGISTPFTSNAQGGTRMLYGDEYVKQQIQILVSDCDSDNPFQADLGIALENVFQMKDDSTWRGRTRAAVTKLFNKYFEPANLARLVSIEYQDPAETQDSEVSGAAASEMIMIITFLSIESNTEQQVKLSTAGGPFTGAAALGLKDFSGSTGGL